MHRRLGLALGLVAFVASTASASPLDLFGFGGRSPGLAGAGVASTEDYDAVYLNPAGLAHVRRKRATVGVLLGAYRLELAGNDYPVEGPRGLEIGGQVPMPLGGALRDRVGLGFGFYVPNQAINRARAPFPSDPTFILLENRAFVVGLMVGVGARITPRLTLGLSVNSLAVLRGTIDVTVDGAGRFTTQSEQRLLTRFAPIAGARYALSDAVDLGLTVRAPSRSDYDIAVTSDLGDAIPLSLPLIKIAGTAQYDPLIVAAEAVWRPTPSLALTGHLAFHRWSVFPRPTLNPVEGNPPQPDLGWRDIVVPRLAAEYRRDAIGGEVTVRGGYAFHMTPTPEQRERELLFDNHRHQLALGLGLAWPHRALPLHVDGWLQVHHLMPRRHDRTMGVQLQWGTGGDLVVGGVTVGVDL